MESPDRSRVEALTGCRVVACERVSGGGYSPAERWRVRFHDGTTAFVKIGAVSEVAVRAVRDEGRYYPELRGDFVPRFHGFDDHPGRPMLVLEDLGHARWPPPWEEGDVERVLEAMARLAASRPLPAGLPRLEDHQRLAGWTDVAEDPAPFLSLGMVSPAWLVAALPVLLEAQRATPLAGDDLVHLDLRSDNLCLLPDRVVVVDWNLACRGNRTFDLAFWAPSLRLEGGPIPEAIVPHAGPMAALVAGFFAGRAGLPEIPSAPRVRWIQRRQLRIALPWACRALGLPEPDGTWARDECTRLDADLAAGRLDRATWWARTEEVDGDAYLATTTRSGCRAGPATRSTGAGRGSWCSTRCRRVPARCSTWARPAGT